mgnify:CR=1 FL=1
MPGLDKESVIKRLGELFNELDDVEVAVLFGSLTKGHRHPRDVDIAVKFSCEKSLLDLAGLTSLIAGRLGVSEDYVDVVDLSEAKPLLLSRILKEGVILKADPNSLKNLYDEALKSIDHLTEVKLWANLDPEPRVDKAIIASRVEEVRRNVEFIKKEILPVEDIDKLRYRDKLALERALHRIAEAMLDVCRHLVATYSLGIVESYGEYPRKLAQAGKMPRELAEELTKLAGLRNIPVHRYLEIDTRKLYEAAQRITEEIAPKFLRWVSSVAS